MKKLLLSSAIALVCVPVFSHATDVTTGESVQAGMGVNYIAKLVFDRTMVKNEDTIVITTGSDLTPNANTDEKISPVGQTKSMGWNDTATNPDKATCTEPGVPAGCITIADVATEGWGWGHNARWYLIDLNPLAGQKVHLHIAVERHDDGQVTETTTNATTGVVTTLASDDDLIPGLTVWKGFQSVGTHLHWFPNKHQVSNSKPFWAGSKDYVTQSSSGLGRLSMPVWKVGKKTYPLKGMNTMTVGYDTAFGAVDNSKAVVMGDIVLSKQDPQQNFITIALGGDARHDATSKKHDVNYKLSVAVHKH